MCVIKSRLIVVIAVSLLYSCSPSMRMKRSINRINRLTAIYPELADTFNLFKTKQVVVKNISVTHTFKPRYDISYPDSLSYHFTSDSVKTAYYPVLVFADTTFVIDIPLVFVVNDSTYEFSVPISLSLTKNQIDFTGNVPDIAIDYPYYKTIYKYTLKKPFWKDTWFWLFVVLMVGLIVSIVILILAKM